MFCYSYILIYNQNYSTKYYEIIDPSINKRGDFMYMDYAEIGRRIAQKRKKKKKIKKKKSRGTGESMP